LMRGVVNICPDRYWIFRYNLECLIAGSQDEEIETLRPFSNELLNIRDDKLVMSMVINGLNKSSWGCSIS